MDTGRACALPVGTILSGPAAGVMGAWAVGRGVGAHRLLTLDIGGTSTDMALIDREPLRTNLGEIEGMPLRLPRLDVHTIGAGGGSIARLDAAGGLRVGPESAGADPGPAAYGKGESPTLTDAHLVLGHLLPQAFGFGRVAVDPDRAGRAIEPLADALGLSLHAAADAIVAQAQAKMARGLRSVSAARGISPETCTLLAFGGAGGLHLCALARMLGVRQWIAPPYPGVLSAYGLLWMDAVHEARRTVLTPLPDTRAVRLDAVLLELRAECERRCRRWASPPTATNCTLLLTCATKGNPTRLPRRSTPTAPRTPARRSNSSTRHATASRCLTAQWNWRPCACAPLRCTPNPRARAGSRPTPRWATCPVPCG
jgi:N-methylhydantoinase A